MPPPPSPPQAWFCPRCGYANGIHAAACAQCATPHPYYAPPAYPPPVYLPPGYPPPVVIVSPPKSRVAFILLGLFLGSLGVHNFYAGYAGRGVAQLLITIFGSFCFFIGPLITAVWALIEIIVVERDAHGLKMS